MSKKLGIVILIALFSTFLIYKCATKKTCIEYNAELQSCLNKQIIEGKKENKSGDAKEDFLQILRYCEDKVLGIRGH